MRPFRRRNTLVIWVCRPRCEGRQTQDPIWGAMRCIACVPRRKGALARTRTALELKDLGNLASTCEGVGYGAHHE